MTKGLGTQYVLLGDPASLICGYQLKSNPPATVSWTDPQGKRVKSGDRYYQDDGPATVQLNISKTTPGDSGTWQCRVEVQASDTHVGSGTSVIGLVHNEIQLNIIGKRVMVILYIIFLKLLFFSSQKPTCRSMCPL